MKDETYAFIQDVKDKKITARSARSTRTHCGKGGKVRLPSDNLSKKELEKMNGECKSYRLNAPMTKEEFQSMPDDLKATYIKLLRSKYAIPDTQLGKAMGYPQQTFAKIVKKLGLGEGSASGGKKKVWDKEGFFAWWNGVDKLPTPVIAEPTQEEAEEPEAHVEEDSPCIHPSQAELELLKAKEESAWLRNENESLRMNIRILEAQMDVVRLIFGGLNHGK